MNERHGLDTDVERWETDAGLCKISTSSTSDKNTFSLRIFGELNLARWPHHHAYLLHSSIKQVVCFGAWEVTTILRVVSFSSPF